MCKKCIKHKHPNSEVYFYNLDILVAHPYVDLKTWCLDKFGPSAKLFIIDGSILGVYWIY